MKKTLTAVSLILLSVACQRELINDKPEEEGMTMEFSASIDDSVNEDNDISKVAVSTTGKVTWTSGDKIAVYNTSGARYEFTLSSGAGQSSAKFTGTFSGTPDVAVYPAAYASSTKGTVTLPSTIDFAGTPSAVPVVMASKAITNDSGTVLKFKNISGVIELNMKDIPAYTRGMKVRSITNNISGNFNFDTASPAGMNATKGSNGVLFRFPYKTGYGSSAVTKFYVPVPIANYTDLYVSFIDGDEDKIEGLEEVKIPAASAKVTAGKYIAMPVLNVRSKVTRDPHICKVEGTLWTDGNLIRKSGVTGSGFQSNWSLADKPWRSIFYDKIDGAGTSADLSQDENNFDHFVWGGIGQKARYGGHIPSPAASLNFQGRIYSDSKCTKELSGDSRFTATEGYGDLAFWASKGKYHMPVNGDLAKLRPQNEKPDKNVAKGQAGYIIDNGHKIYGMLFTSTTYDEVSSLNQEAIEMTEADLESGLFLPKVGRRFNTDKTGNAVRFVNNQGYYWSCVFNPIDGEHKTYEHCARGLGFRLGNSIDYGYTTNINGTNVTDIEAGLAIRPIKICSNQPDPEINPTSKSLEPWQTGEMDLHFINSGRGECNFIIMTDGTTMMIDAGEYLNDTPDDEASEGKKVVHRKPSDDTNVRPYKVYTTYARYFMKNISEKKLDYFLATHFHNDHIGTISKISTRSEDGYITTGVAAVCEDLPIQKLVDRFGPNGDFSASTTLENYKAFANARVNKYGMEWYKVNLTPENHDNQFPPKGGSTCKVSVIGGNGYYWNGSSFGHVNCQGNENACSITVKVSFGDFNAYFGADCNASYADWGADIMQKIAKNCGKVELYKAAHHLYSNTYTSEIAGYLKPKVTVAHCLHDDRPSGTALTQTLSTGKVFCTNCEVAASQSKVTDYGGHFCVRVKKVDNVTKFWVYKLKDTDFSYEVLATYGPYSCH